MLIKLLWAIRGLLYKPFLGHWGWKSYLGKPIFLSNMKSIWIGNRVRIYPGIRIECLKDASLVIEEDCSIGQNLHLTVGDKLVIGKGTTISSNVLITDIDHEYKQIGVPIMEQPLKIKKTKIGENCFIGTGAVILPGTILGKQCVVGANAIVRGVFADYSVIAGNPGKVIKRFNEEYDYGLHCSLQKSI